jgi:hypothetical protein
MMVYIKVWRGNSKAPEKWHKQAFDEDEYVIEETIVATFSSIL